MLESKWENQLESEKIKSNEISEFKQAKIEKQRQEVAKVRSAAAK